MIFDFLHLALCHDRKNHLKLKQEFRNISQQNEPSDPTRHVKAIKVHEDGGETLIERELRSIEEIFK